MSRDAIRCTLWLVVAGLALALLMALVGCDTPIHDPCEGADNRTTCETDR